MINLLIEGDRLEIVHGGPEPVDVSREGRRPQRVFRCPDCRVAVFSEYGGPALKFVRGGTLDDPDGVVPDVHIYTRSKLPWVALPEGVPAFEAYYDSQSLWPAASLERRRAILG